MTSAAGAVLASSPVTSGLSEAEAAARRAAAPNRASLRRAARPSAIVRANTLTPFNAILLALGVLTLTFGDWRDALFLGIIVTNTGIGIWQELRAKQKLDALAALVAPRATVVRDGEPRPLHVSEVVEGDLVRLAAGDQVVADGFLLASSGLRFDESILTGESAAVERAEGEEVRSGRSSSREPGRSRSLRSVPRAMPSGSRGRRASSAIRGHPSSARSTGSSTCCSP